MRHTIIVEFNNKYYIAQRAIGTANTYRVLATMTSKAAAELVLAAFTHSNSADTVITVTKEKQKL